MFMKQILSILMLIASLPPITARTISDMGMAREWCDRSMLQSVEGIWEFPADETRVLVRQTTASARRFDIIVIDTPDTRLTPGETIGTLTESPVTAKFELDLYRNRMKGLLANPGKCLAEYIANEDAMVITARKIKLSLASRWFLPSFWKALRINFKDPLDQLPRGMVRIYPTSKPRKIDYL